MVCFVQSHIEYALWPMIIKYIQVHSFDRLPDYAGISIMNGFKRTFTDKYKILYWTGHVLTTPRILCTSWSCRGVHRGIVNRFTLRKMNIILEEGDVLITVHPGSALPYICSLGR